ncbi:hypothetical protein [Paenibacillus daejeonensis]|uniref:hypothetical protein n=1 Tax=Paenibacillus daejeonensis TaxID=135193 RepID=UPI0003A55562|nr:hypothetical protein [Paenibacillus daejeonensis]
MKRVWKITLWTTGIMGLLVVTAAGLLYWKLTSMDLGDIRERHVLQADPGTEGQEGSEGAEGSEAGGGGALPPSLSSAVSKADTLADKPIQSDDALDAAAILLQSGLSFREMYYLLGKSTDTLSTEEKQHIRDLLLAKLKREEIESLRAITSGYGKNLVILDPNYPIEAVGVKDDAERDRIIYEHRKKAKAAAEQSGDSPQPTAAAQPNAGAAPGNTPASGPSTTTGAAEGDAPVASSDAPAQSGSQPSAPTADASKPSATASAGGQEPQKNEAASSTPPQTSGQSGQAGPATAEQLTASYHRQLQSLKSSCVQEAERMLSQIISHLDKADSVSAAGAAEQDLMEQVSVAEERCDRQYEQLVAQAEAEFKKAKLSFAAGKTWDQEYEQAKASIRNRATSQIQSRM